MRSKLVAEVVRCRWGPATWASYTTVEKLVGLFLRYVLKRCFKHWEVKLERRRRVVTGWDGGGIAAAETGKWGWWCPKCRQWC